jgi:hypothetical protein
MNAVRKRIYLVASEETPWVGRFLAEANERCDVVCVSPQQLSPTAEGEAFSAGIVVLYESQHGGDTELLERIRRDAHYIDLPVVVVAGDSTPAALATRGQGGDGMATAETGGAS